MYAFSVRLRSADFDALRAQVEEFLTQLHNGGHQVQGGIVCGTVPGGSFKYPSFWNSKQAVTDALSILVPDDQFAPPPQPAAWITLEQDYGYVKGAYWLGYEPGVALNPRSLYGYKPGAGPSLPLASQYVYCGLSTAFVAPGNASLNGLSLDVWVPRSLLGSTLGRRVINSLLQGHDQRNPPAPQQDALVVGMGDGPVGTGNPFDADAQWTAFVQRFQAAEMTVGTGTFVSGS